MKFSKFKILIVLLFILTVGLYNSVFPRFLVSGKYIAKIENEFGSFGISNGDQLILHTDGTFQSNSLGNGTYSQKGKQIQLSSTTATIQTYFNRPFLLGKPRIIIYRDLNSEFIKE